MTSPESFERIASRELDATAEAHASTCAAFVAGFLEGQAYYGADDYRAVHAEAKRLAQGYWGAMWAGIKPSSASPPAVSGTNATPLENSNVPPTAGSVTP